LPLFEHEQLFFAQTTAIRHGGPERNMSELEFKSLAAQGFNRIPLLAEAFADLETPLTLYLKLAQTQNQGKNTFLLESVVGGERFLAFCDHSCFCGVQLARGFVVVATLTAFTAAFTALATAFAAFTAAFTAFTTLGAGCALCAHFGAISGQLGRGLVAVVVTALAAAFAGLAFTSGALGALTACWTAFTIAHFVATFATASTFAWCAAFALNAFGALCALATAAITTTTAAITTTLTAFTVALAVAAFAGFFVFLASHCGLGFFGAATEQALEPAEEATAGNRCLHRWGGFGSLGCCGRGSFETLEQLRASEAARL
jgi:hypothetical protein